jgi:hypothetical protein
MKNKHFQKRITAATVTIIFGFYLMAAPFSYAYELVISGNGSGSVNQVEAIVKTEVAVEQNNEAEITNSVNTQADTGNNQVANSGDSTIATGDIVQSVDVTNDLNKSAAEVVVCCQQDVKVDISGNGSGSSNYVSLNVENNKTVNVDNSAKITNSVNGYANTGGNSITGSNEVTIDTGNIKASAVIENDVNTSNVITSNSVGSLITHIYGNGPFSQNYIVANIKNENNINVNNNSFINNFVDWFLNTGQNSVNGANGKVNIRTGDIIYDLFINNKANLSSVLFVCCQDPVSPGDDDPVTPAKPDDNNTGGNTDNQKPEGKLLPFAAATEYIPLGGPMIMGLSDTTSQAARTVFFWAGIILIAAGVSVIGKDITHTSINKSGKKS